MNIFVNKFKNFVKHSISDLIIIRDAILIMTCIVPYVYMYVCIYLAIELILISTAYT